MRKNRYKNPRPQKDDLYPYGLMSLVNGAPINLLHCISLLSSATLAGAAFLLPFRPSLAAKVGLAGSVLSWVFYGPLIVASLVAPFSIWLEIKTFITFHDYVPTTGIRNITHRAKELRLAVRQAAIAEASAALSSTAQARFQAVRTVVLPPILLRFPIRQLPLRQSTMLVLLRV